MIRPTFAQKHSLDLVAPQVDVWSVVFLILVQCVIITGLLNAHAPQRGLRHYQQRLYLPLSPLLLTAFVYLFMAYLESSVFDLLVEQSKAR